jgi:hypothetical protein
MALVVVLTPSEGRNKISVEMRARRGLVIGFFAAAMVGGAEGGALAQSTVTALFAHVAVGGGYTTTFTLLNTGSTTLTGNLILTKQDGSPLSAAFAGPSSFSATSASVPLTIPIGGTQFWVASTAGDPSTTVAGWARVESSGGTLGGVATFEYAPGGTLSTIAGVLSAESVQFATIPVDDNHAQGRDTGYAVANPSSTDTINIKVVPVSALGVEQASLATITLGPGAQKARFLFEDASPPWQFQGSVVLIEQSGKRFAVVALVFNQSLYTAIPVIPAKAPGIN